MLEPINVATKELQTNGATVAKCRDVLDSIIEAVATEKKVRNAPLCDCKLDGRYMGNYSSILQYPDFERGFTKIENGMGNSLSRSETISVEMLLCESSIAENDTNVSEMISTQEVLLRVTI